MLYSRHLIGKGFDLDPRGPTEIKGKGLMDTYFVRRGTHNDSDNNGTNIQTKHFNGAVVNEVNGTIVQSKHQSDEQELVYPTKCLSDRQQLCPGKSFNGFGKTTFPTSSKSRSYSITPATTKKTNSSLCTVL